MVKTYRVYQVDSFTKTRFCGNPAGVVPNADGLSESQMQHIARELNNSETAFIFNSNQDDYDVEVRFFTPTTEVPICGHATIAAHYVRALETGISTGRVLQKTKAGILPVDIMREGEDIAVVMTQTEPVVGEDLGKDVRQKIAEALNIKRSDICEKYPIVIASTGHAKVMIPLNSTKTLNTIKPNEELLIKLSNEIGCNGFYSFTLNPDEDILVHGRMFAPSIGISEDPVTGNANGPLGAYLVHYGILQDEHSDHFDFNIIQGESIGRPGTMYVDVKKEKGEPKLVQIKGSAVITFKTEIEL